MQQLPTWGRQSPPLDAPSAPCNAPIRVESQLHNIGSACDVVREGRTAAFLHQDCTVAICDCQVVMRTCRLVLKVKGCEFQEHGKSWLHLNRLCLIEAVWVVFRVVWRGDCP